MPLVKQPLRVIGIVRVSTSEQEIGEAAQEEAIKTWCERQGAVLVATFTDAGVSGAAPLEKREELLRAFRLAEHEDIDILLAAKGDRFARSSWLRTDIERLAAKIGVTLATADGAYSHKPEEGDLLRRRADQFVAEIELDRIRIRNKARARACIRRGQVHGGHVPYGFRRKKGGREGTRNTVVELEPDPKEYPTLVRARELRASGGSYRDVADGLNQEGFTMRNKKPWHRARIYRLLRRGVEKSESANQEAP